MCLRDFDPARREDKSINQLLSTDADQVCGAANGTISDDRVNRRNGYRHRDFDTGAGTLDVKIPKLRQRTYFPEWLLERRRRAEATLTTVVATSYLLGSRPVGWMKPLARRANRTRPQD